MTTQKGLSEAVNSDTRIRVLGEFSGGRLAITIPTTLIQRLPDLSQLRAADPKDVDKLTRSIKATDGETLYPILLFVEIGDDGLPVYFIGDGHQRLRGLIENAVRETTALVVLRWRNVSEAMADSLGANVARLEVKEADTFNIFRSGKVTDDQIKSITGYSDSKMKRLKAVAPHLWMCDLVAQECLGYSKAASMLMDCSGNGDKIAALENSLMEIKKVADERVSHYRKEEKRGALDPKNLKWTTLTHCFKEKRTDIDAIAKAIKTTEKVERDVTGKLCFDTDVYSGKMLVASVGPDDEFADKLPVYNFFGRPVSEIPLESFDTVLGELPRIKRWMEYHRDRLREKEYAKRNPMPKTGEYLEEESESVAPTVQKPKSAIDAE